MLRCDRTGGTDLRCMILAAMLAASGVNAEPLANINDLIAQIDGQEVSVSGRIGHRISGQGLLLTENSQYRVRYALPRDQLSAVEACEFNSQGQGCLVRILSEIDVEDGYINLIAFDITFLPD